MNSRPLIAAFAGAVVLLLLWQSVFTVRETEYAMNLDWGGKIVRSDYAAGPALQGAAGPVGQEVREAAS